MSSQAQVREITREDPALGGKSQSFVVQGDARAWLCKGQQFLWRKEEPLCTGQSLHVSTWSACGNGCRSFISLSSQFHREQEAMSALGACSSG